MSKHIQKLWMATPVVLLAGWAGKASAAVVPDSEHVAKLLSEAKTMAFQLKEDAVAMEGFTRMNVSWESHAAAIDQIKDHVKALEKQEAKLKEARSCCRTLAKDGHRPDRALLGRIGRLHVRDHRTASLSSRSGSSPTSIRTSWRRMPTMRPTSRA